MPEKVSNPSAESSSQEEVGAEEVQDWIILSTAEAREKFIGNVESVDMYDGQHPRNLFSKKTQAKRAKSTERNRVSEVGIDWSQEGMPIEVKKQIVRASMTASHRGPYAKEQASPIPLNVLRTQNRSGSIKRQNSLPKTPRSQSKPRVIQQPA